MIIIDHIINFPFISMYQYKVALITYLYEVIISIYTTAQDTQLKGKTKGQEIVKFVSRTKGREVIVKTLKAVSSKIT